MATPLRLPFPAAVAVRYLKSTRKDAFVSFLSLTAAGGIALGVAALILALAALTGFQELLKGEILARTPQVQVRLPAGTGAETTEELIAAIEGLPEVRSVHRFVRGRGWLLGAGSIRAVQLIGYDGEPPGSFFPGLEGRGEGLYLGDRLASSWGLSVGDVVEVASSKPTLSPVGPQPRVRRLAVAGTFEIGRTEQVDRAAVPLAEAERLLGRREVYLEVATGSLATALDVAPQVEEILRTAEVEPSVDTWQGLNRPLFFALKLEKGVMFIAVFLIIVVASLALISGISLLVSKKGSEIGMFGAMGATPGTLWRAFMILGGLLASIGILVGGTVGIFGSWALDRFELLALPAEVYFIDHVPFSVRWIDVGGVLFSTLALALLCASFAASRAAGILPVEALRR